MPFVRSHVNIFPIKHSLHFCHVLWEEKFRILLYQTVFDYNLNKSQEYFGSVRHSSWILFIWKNEKVRSCQNVRTNKVGDYFWKKVCVDEENSIHCDMFLNWFDKKVNFVEKSHEMASWSSYTDYCNVL